MISFAKFVINDLSVKVFEYPEIIIPEQGLKKNLYYVILKQYNLMQELEF